MRLLSQTTPNYDQMYDIFFNFRQWCVNKDGSVLDVLLGIFLKHQFSP